MTEARRFFLGGETKPRSSFRPTRRCPREVAQSTSHSNSCLPDFGGMNTECQTEPWRWAPQNSEGGKLGGRKSNGPNEGRKRSRRVFVADIITACSIGVEASILRIISRSQADVLLVEVSPLGDSIGTCPCTLCIAQVPKPHLMYLLLAVLQVDTDQKIRPRAVRTVLLLFTGTSVSLRDVPFVQADFTYTEFPMSLSHA